MGAVVPDDVGVCSRALATDMVSVALSYKTCVCGQEYTKR